MTFANYYDKEVDLLSEISPDEWGKPIAGKETAIKCRIQNKQSTIGIGNGVYVSYQNVIWTDHPLNVGDFIKLKDETINKIIRVDSHEGITTSDQKQWKGYI